MVCHKLWQYNFQDGDYSKFQFHLSSLRCPLLIIGSIIWLIYRGETALLLLLGYCAVRPALHDPSHDQLRRETGGFPLPGLRLLEDTDRKNLLSELPYHDILLATLCIQLFTQYQYIYILYIYKYIVYIVLYYVSSIEFS